MVRDSSSGPASAREPERILIRGVNWLGDAVMTTPALQQLRAAKPRAQLVLLTPAKLAGLWTGQPFLDDTIVIGPADNPSTVARRLKTGQFTAAIAFPNSFRAALELWLAGIPRRIGVSRPPRNFLLTTVVRARPRSDSMRKRSDKEIHRALARGLPSASYPSSSHHVHNYLRLTAELGASLQPLAPRLTVNEEERQKARERFHIDTNDTARPWLGLNPGAEYGPAKRWPARHFVETAVALRTRLGARWLVFGGAADAKLAGDITNDIRRHAEDPSAAFNLAGETSLRELAAALSLCRLVLTNDTGPMHLAAAVGAPVVAIFGSTSPDLTGPIYSPKVQILRESPACAPCFRRECPIDLRCMTAVTPHAAVEAALRLLHK